MEPSYFSGDNIDQFEFLVKLLIHLDVLDPERDVGIWLDAIREYCNNQRYLCCHMKITSLSGRLSRGDILAFAESYRRKFLSLDNRNILTPPMPSNSNPLPRKSSPSTRAYSPALNFQQPSNSSPKYSIEMESPTRDDRTPLLPINSQYSSKHQTFSESPLTLGKKSSYGLFIPQGYQHLGNNKNAGAEMSIPYETDEDLRIGSP